MPSKLALAGLMLLLAGCAAGDAAPNAGASLSRLPKFKAFGTEPFWSVDTGKSMMRYADPELQDEVDIPASVRIEGQTYIWEGVRNGERFTLAIRRAHCSDGMSDIVHGYEASLFIGDRIEHGCARLN